MLHLQAIIIGAGPNGLSAGIALARAGLAVRIYEANDCVGGGARSEWFPGTPSIVDTCSAIHPLGAASPFWRELPLAEHGLEWIEPPVAVAHPFDARPAACLVKSLDATSSGLDNDAAAYRRVFEPFLVNAERFLGQVLGPPQFPSQPLLLGRFASHALRSARGFVDRHFVTARARGLFAGMAAHSGLSLSERGTSATALMLAIAGHTVGWPLPRGGAQSISNALASCFMALGGEIVLNRRVSRASDIPPAKVVLFDLHPRHVVRILGEAVPGGYLRQVARFRPGTGVFKIDWLLRAPVPFRDRACCDAGTVHLGGEFEEITASERVVSRGGCPQRPFVLLAQQSRFDSSRTPDGRQIAWAYCHVPRYSLVDMTDAIESQVERFAPGFRDCILQRKVAFPAELEARNANCIGGDISGGAPSLRQLLFRPTFSLNPYRLPVRGYYLCSASTPPGPGVHGMCGYHAARVALKDHFPELST